MEGTTDGRLVGRKELSDALEAVGALEADGRAVDMSGALVEALEPSKTCGICTVLILGRSSKSGGTTEAVLGGGLTLPGRASYPVALQSGQISFGSGVTRTTSGRSGSRSASVI